MICNINNCTNDTINGKKICQHHLKRIRANSERWAEKQRASGLCVCCGCVPANGRRKCSECSQRHGEARKIRYRAFKHDVMSRYGTVCQCCGEPELDFLAIDHIEGGGNEHRRKISADTGTLVYGSKFYFWLRDNDFPSGFQVLCHNCNFAKHAFGVCPHQEEKK